MLLTQHFPSLELCLLEEILLLFPVVSTELSLEAFFFNSDLIEWVDWSNPGLFPILFLETEDLRAKLYLFSSFSDFLSIPF